MHHTYALVSCMHSLSTHLHHSVGWSNCPSGLHLSLKLCASRSCTNHVSGWHEYVSSAPKSTGCPFQSYVMRLSAGGCGGLRQCVGTHGSTSSGGDHVWFQVQVNVWGADDGEGRECGGYETIACTNLKSLRLKQLPIRTEKPKVQRIAYTSLKTLRLKQLPMRKLEIDYKIW